MLYCRNASVTIICRLIVSKWEIRFQVIIGYAAPFYLIPPLLMSSSYSSVQEFLSITSYLKERSQCEFGYGVNAFQFCLRSSAVAPVISKERIDRTPLEIAWWPLPRRDALAAPADRRPALPSARRRYSNHLVIKASPYHNRASHLWRPHTNNAHARPRLW